MSRVVLVRHGESEWNVERRVQGQGGTGLTGRGERQAALSAESVVRAHPDAILVASDLQRCRETAAAFADLLDREPEWDQGLRERHFGDWTGLLATEIGERDRDRWERWRSGGDVLGEVGGESTATLIERVVATVRGRVAAANGHTVVCVTHGGPVWHGTHALLGIDEPVLGGVANGSITELVVEDGHAYLLAWNQTSHLPIELRALPEPNEDDVEPEQADEGAAGG